VETITIALVISILGIALNVFNFYYSRKKDTIIDVKEQDKESSNQQLIDYRLTQVEKKLDKILDILDNYDKEIDERVSKAMEQHIEVYHKGEK
jgi:hypothetical protein